MKNSHFNGLAVSSPVPLYNQIRELLRARILDGTHTPLSRMPSEYELCDLFGVSRITVRQALNDLQKDGLIFKIHGKGTFVAKPKAYQNISSLQGLAESLVQQGYEVINQVRSIRYFAAPQEIVAKLALEPGVVVAEIQRVRLINREPVSLEVTYLPEKIGRQLEKADLVMRDIFLILENDLGIALGHANLAIDAILADGELTQALKAEENSPIMRIERLTHTDAGAPLDFEYLYYRGDAFQYRLRIDRQRGGQSSVNNPRKCL
jgi:GntR family transcriptional regulator